MNTSTSLPPPASAPTAVQTTPSRLSYWVAARWALVPFALLGTLSAGLAVMVRIAVHDPGFAVEPEYYQHALNWDEQRARQERSARLGWTLGWNLAGVSPGTAGVVASAARMRPLSLSLTDAFGAPLGGARISVSAFHNARAADVQHLLLAERATGEYAGELQLRAEGIWHLQVEVDAHGQHFSQSNDVDLDLEHGRVLSDRNPVSPAAVATAVNSGPLSEAQ